MTMPDWTNPPNVYTPQAHYSQVARIGNTLYISGQLGLDIDGGAFFGGGHRPLYVAWASCPWSGRGLWPLFPAGTIAEP